MSRKQQMDPQTDLLVEWKDGTKNVVKIQDIILVSRKLEKGCKISMKWGQQTWEGRVLDVEGNIDSDDSDSDSDIPLAQLKANNQTKAQDTYGSSQMPARCDDFFCSGEVWAACNKSLCFLCYDHFLVNKDCSTHNLYHGLTQTSASILQTETPLCAAPSGVYGHGLQYQTLNSELFDSSSTSFTELLLAGHECVATLPSSSSYPSSSRTPSTLSVGGCAPLAGHDGLTSLSSNSSVPATQLPPSTLSVGGCAPFAAGHEHLASLPSSSSLPSSQCHHSLCYDAHSEQYDVQPDDFRVDGESRPLSPNVVKTPKSKNLAVKHNRNRGIAYIMEKSNKCVPSKHGKLGESNCCFCKFQGRDCPKISTEQRHQIREAYYNMADLQKQREWIIRHVVVNQVSDLKRNYSYYLPQITNEGQKWKVCRQMFTSTIGVSVCQVRTALSKIDQFDVLEGEKRGGQQMVEKDQTKREQVKAHINKFPRMESHYCRANSKCQYLSPDLNFSIMYKMYLKDHPNGASMTFYKKVFKSFNLKFHHAKKDMCGLCETFHHASAKHKKELQQQYYRHVLEKEKSRELKNIAKEKATIDNKYHAAVFDLQQVIYLPKSDRSELFYKRRLSCFNFTIFELASKDGFCFVSHEGRTGRGSCEIASFLHRYLSTVDEQGCETVELYSDGCIGQNKNSIIPAMILYFVERSISVQQVTLNFFETNRGQSEGDAMHSTIERQMRQIGEMFVPSQLVTLIKMDRKNPRPYRVTSVESSDILDWKTYSQSWGLLCVRSSEAGTKVDWKKFMQIRVNKEDSNTIKFKYSHDDDDFEILRIDGRRRHSTDQAQLAEPLQCYPLGAHSIPKAKYDDLISLCTGQTPVVSHPDYQAFYRQLSH